ncbi:MAG TPA: hypothetical protein ENJ06_04830 [Phycisphaeraceae bacterium]|nr:hypothetical protein [Phycisphaeraceae bacterium]
MSEWDNINSLEGWQNKLQSLLTESEAAARSDDIDERLQMNRRLTEFILHSHPNTPEILRLDRIAEQARSGLMRATIEERLAELAARTGELARLNKQLRMEAEANEAIASSIRLEKATRVVKSITETIKDLHSFADALDSEDDEDLKKSMERLVASLQRIRNEVENRSRTE